MILNFGIRDRDSRDSDGSKLRDALFYTQFADI